MGLEYLPTYIDPIDFPVVHVGDIFQSQWQIKV